MVVIAAGKRYGFEFTYADAPGTTRSMHIADKISAIPLDNMTRFDDLR